MAHNKTRRSPVQIEAQAKLGKRKRARKMPWERPGLSRVERVLAFLEFLPITKGILIGRNLELLPDQRRFIEAVYGGSPKRLAVFSEPRGNGKTGLVSGLGLCHLLGPEAEPRGECYSAAVNRLQSTLMFNEMAAIVEMVPEFCARTNIRRGGLRRFIEVVSGDGAGSSYEAMSADARRGHGLAPSWWAYDEMGQVSDRRLFDALQTGMGKRRQSIGFVISTQAPDDDHPLSELIDHGAADPNIVVHCRSAPRDANPFDPDVIRAANPALGKFLNERDVMAEAAQARLIPSNESAFRNLRLNQRIAATADLLVQPGDWERGAEPINEDIFRDGRPVYGGLDLSARLDLTAFVLAAEDDDGVIHFKPMAWTPEKTLMTRTQRDGAPYDAWHRDGLLQATPGITIDYDYVVADIGAAIDGMNVIQIANDSWNINALKLACARVGLLLPLEQFVQGWKSYTPAISEFKVACAEGRIRHGGHPVLRWCVFNTCLVHAPGTPQENRKPDKRRLYGRIDLAVAALMATGAMKVTAAVPAEVAAMIA